jgi:peptidoglycan/xylan/chitin deacetylase (PgdA/CDA1 family)
MKKLIKAIILNGGYYLGFFELLRRSNGRKGRVPILVYHRVLASLDEGNVYSAFKLRGLTVSPRNFERQISYLRRKYHLLSLVEYVKRKKTGSSLKNCAVITFDDGFKDFITQAWPILKKYQAPATMFMPSGFLDLVHWQHQLYAILDEPKIEKAAIRLGCEEVPLDLRNDREKYLTIRRFIAAIGGLAPAERQRMVNYIGDVLQVTKKLTPAELYLTKEDLRLLVKEGVSLGAHSVSHEHLEGLDEQQLDEEITKAMEFIKELTGEYNSAFALPFSTGNEKVYKKLEAHGCLCSFSNESGLNTGAEDDFHLKRVAGLDVNLAEFVYDISRKG